jgi:uncharacterized protein (TIGR04255 family)
MLKDVPIPPCKSVNHGVKCKVWCQLLFGEGNMSKKLFNAPVYFTVAQIQFNPVLNMEGYLPAIQDKMRIAHFPDFKRDSVQQLTIPFASSSQGGQVVAPSFVPRARSIFGNMEGTTEFVLENNALALQTTAYDTFETFSKTLLDGLEIVHGALQLDFTQRVGLRYLDAVLPNQGESLSDYLTSEVLGLALKLTESKLSHSFSETVTLSSKGKLVSRVIIQEGPVGLPPEILTLAPRIDPRFMQFNGLHAIIDTDAFTEQRESFDIREIDQGLLALHDEIQKSFSLTVTPTALERWS